MRWAEDGAAPRWSTDVGDEAAVIVYCPSCWQEVPFGASECGACGCVFALADAANFEEKLIRALNHPEPETRQRAAEILGRRRARGAVAALLQRWRQRPDPYLAAGIARALGNIGGPAAAAALREITTDDSVMVRVAARDALAKIGQDEI